MIESKIEMELKHDLLVLCRADDNCHAGLDAIKNEGFRNYLANNWHPGPVQVVEFCDFEYAYEVVEDYVARGGSAITYANLRNGDAKIVHRVADECPRTITHVGSWMME